MGYGAGDEGGDFDDYAISGRPSQMNKFDDSLNARATEKRQAPSVTKK